MISLSSGCLRNKTLNTISKCDVIGVVDRLYMCLLASKGRDRKLEKVQIWFVGGFFSNPYLFPIHSDWVKEYGFGQLSVSLFQNCSICRKIPDISVKKAKERSANKVRICELIWPQMAIIRTAKFAKG